MTALTQRIGGLAAALIGGGVVDAGRSQRAGALVMPVQTAENSAAMPANTTYSLPFTPGFEEGPEWPVETWILSSFQVTLSGTLVVPLELELTSENEALPIVLALIQHGRPVWSQNIALRLIPELGSEKRVFKFQVGVFVDLVNPLRYEAGSQPYFVVSGVVPIYVPPGPTFESETLERLDSLLTALQQQNATQAEIVAVLESSGATEAEIVAVLEASGATEAEIQTALETAGATQQEALEVLEQIATNTKGEP